MAPLMVLMYFVIGILGCVFVCPYILLIVDRFKGTHYSCTMWGWHNGKGGVSYAGEMTNDGCSNHGTCSKCGKHVMQDSQGNWF